VEKSKSVTQRHVIDLTFGVRAFNACWLSASFGISMLQMLLLAQSWRSSQNALVPACLASVWALGSLLGARPAAMPACAGVPFLPAPCCGWSVLCWSRGGSPIS